MKIDEMNFDTLYLNISLFSLHHCIRFFSVEKTRCAVTLTVQELFRRGYLGTNFRK